MSDKKRAGETWAINVPSFGKAKHVTLDEATSIVAEGRWVFVNASLKRVTDAVEEASKLSNAVNHPMVLVYMPKAILDGQRNEYNEKFEQSLANLVKIAEKDEKDLLVCARSYGVHQALRVVRWYDTPSVLLEGIAPAFGAFGNALSLNVRRYIVDVAKTRSKYCMIASFDDGFTWRSGGAAVRVGDDWRGDEGVGFAMDENHENVVTLTIDDADHAPIDEYLEHGLVETMRKGVKHFGMSNLPIHNLSQ